MHLDASARLKASPKSDAPRVLHSGLLPSFFCKLLHILENMEAPQFCSNPEASFSIFGFGMGSLTLFFNFLTMWLQLLKSGNRCYAIIFPVHYHLNFTTKNAKVSITAVMVVTLLCISTSFIESCNYYFNTQIYMWTNRPGSCAEISVLTDPTFEVSTLIGSLICDAVTLSYILVANKKTKNTHSNSVFNERKFFFQVKNLTLKNTNAIRILDLFYYISLSDIAII